MGRKLVARPTPRYALPNSAASARVAETSAVQESAGKRAVGGRLGGIGGASTVDERKEEARTYRERLSKGPAKPQVRACMHACMRACV